MFAIEHDGNGKPQVFYYHPANIEQEDWRNHRGTFVLEKSYGRWGNSDEEKDARTAKEEEKEKMQGRQSGRRGKESTRLVFPAG